jgi:hypothetical protein
MEAFLGARFLASEFTTSNGGRVDILRIDENGSPVMRVHLVAAGKCLRTLVPAVQRRLSASGSVASIVRK